MLNDIEMKLLRLALDKGAYPGESDNAAVMLVRKLRERNASADELFAQSNPKKSNNISVYGQWRMPFGKYKDELLMDIPTDYLLWVLQNCRSIKLNLRHAIKNVIYGEMKV